MVRLKKYWFLIAIFNSLYLSFVNLKGFFLETNLLELEKAFTVLIFTNPLILIILFYISFIKKDPRKEIVFRKLLLILSLLIVTLMIVAFVYNALRDNSSSLYEYFASTFVEILSISLAIDKERTKKIQDLVGYFSLCFLTAILSFSLIGFLEKYFYDGEISNRLIIVYTATFFHFFNACFLIWKSSTNTFPNQKTSNPEF